MFDIDETVLSQYSASPRIKALLRGFNKLIDPKADIKLFYDKVFNSLPKEKQSALIGEKVSFAQKSGVSL